MKFYSSGTAIHHPHCKIWRYSLKNLFCKFSIVKISQLLTHTNYLACSEGRGLLCSFRFLPFSFSLYVPCVPIVALFFFHSISLPFVFSCIIGVIFFLPSLFLSYFIITFLFYFFLYFFAWQFTNILIYFTISYYYSCANFLLLFSLFFII